MLKRDSLIKFVDKTLGEELLEKSLKKDELANGVQIFGRNEVEKVTLGVSCNEDFLLEAAKSGSNFSIFHHGLDFRTFKSRLPLYTQKRLKIIYQNQMTIMGFHYALDAHPEFGNNASIIKKLGAKINRPLWEEWGYVAEFNNAQDVKKLADKCSEIFEHDVLAIYTGPKTVKTIGVVSGAAKPYAAEIAEMEAKGVELFISGETSESTPHKMKESGINYFVCGHYATEQFGVQELGKVIKKEFKDRIRVEFLDIPNPV